MATTGFMFTVAGDAEPDERDLGRQRLRGLQRPGVWARSARTTWIRCCKSPPTARLSIIGETPVNFSTIYVQNKSRVGGVEALYIYRPSELPLGGNLEFTAGGRYFELKDQFWVDARGGNLTDSYWNTTSHNEIGGPEIGVR